VKRLAVASGLVVVALGLAACGSSSPTASSTTSTTHPKRKKKPTTTTTTTTTRPTTTTTTTTTTQPPTTTTTLPPVTTTTAPAVTTCTSAQLQVHSLGPQAALGHIGLVIAFTNASATTCTLSGYPGVALLNSSGSQVAQAVRTPSGYLGGLQSGQPIPVVTIAAGASASALVEGTDDSASGGSCTIYPEILVTPPNLRQAVPLTSSLPGCTPVQVHPVVPGTTGSTS